MWSISCSVVDLTIRKEENKMKKQDLRSGMLVLLRNGIRYLVMLDYDTVNYGKGVLIRENGFIPLLDYKDDLTNLPNGFFWDIIEVLEINNICEMSDFDEAETIWKREEPKTLTQKEHDFLGSLQLECWAARDENGLINLYNMRPEKRRDEWKCPFGSCIRLKKDLFPFIEWEDKEPYSSIEMLKWKIKE